MYNARSKSSRDGNAELMEESVKDPKWWMCMFVLDLLFSILRESQRWARGCPCHFEAMKTHGTPPLLRARWKSCRLKGMRLPEVVSGDFLEMFKRLCMVCASQFLLKCGPSISETDKKELLGQFECGRGTLLYSISVKVLPLMEPPYLLCGMAHHLIDRARRAFEHCLACRSTFKQILKLQAEPLYSQAIAFLSGTPFDELLELELFVAEFMFGSCDETPVEAVHARLERRVGCIHHRGEAYDSLILRMDYYRMLMQKDAKCKDIVNDVLTSAKNPRGMLKTLGFGQHPALLELIADKAHPWDCYHRKILYHADMRTLYHDEPVDIELVDNAPPDEPGAPSADAAPPDAAPDEPGAAGVPPAQEQPQGPEQGSAGVPPVLQGGLYEMLLSIAAVDAVQIHFGDDEGESTTRMYSLPVTPGALSSLQSLLADKGVAVSHPLAWLDGAIEQSQLPPCGPAGTGESKHVFVSLINRLVSASKRVVKGHLTQGDAAMLVHRVWNIDAPAKAAIVGTTPLNVEKLIEGDGIASSASDRAFFALGEHSGFASYAVVFDRGCGARIQLGALESRGHCRGRGHAKDGGSHKHRPWMCQGCI